MVVWIPVLLAEALALKALAVLALCLVAYLYWTSIREKLEQRRHRRWQEQRRRDYEQKLAQEQKVPPST